MADIVSPIGPFDRLRYDRACAALRRQNTAAAERRYGRWAAANSRVRQTTRRLLPARRRLAYGAETRLRVVLGVDEERESAARASAAERLRREEGEMY